MPVIYFLAQKFRKVGEAMKWHCWISNDNEISPLHLNMENVQKVFGGSEHKES